MELKDVERHARALMTLHGVGSLEFGFDRAKRRIGATHVVTIGTTTLAKKITISKHYAVLLTPDELREVMLHEIAHALVPGHDHDAVWRAAARKIGSKATRCVRTSARPEYSIVVRCDTCDKDVKGQERLPQSIYVHSTCKKPLTYYRNGSKVAFSNMPLKYQNRYRLYQQKGLI